MQADSKPAFLPSCSPGPALGLLLIPRDPPSGPSSALQGWILLRVTRLQTKAVKGTKMARQNFLATPHFSSHPRSFPVTRSVVEKLPHPSPRIPEPMSWRTLQFQRSHFTDRETGTRRRKSPTPGHSASKSGSLVQR